MVNIGAFSQSAPQWYVKNRDASVELVLRNDLRTTNFTEAFQPGAPKR
jgi:hypothetical protein